MPENHISQPEQSSEHEPVVYQELDQILSDMFEGKINPDEARERMRARVAKEKQFAREPYVGYEDDDGSRLRNDDYGVDDHEAKRLRQLAREARLSMNTKDVDNLPVDVENTEIL